MKSIHQEVKLVKYPECDLTDHEDSDYAIRKHWHCKYYASSCHKLHRTKKEANSCKGG